MTQSDSAAGTAVTGINPVTEAGRMPPKNYDAVLLASFGGPEGQDDVLPFLRNVTRGRGILDERLEEVSHHYRANGGISPINQRNRGLKAALESELAARGIELPVLWGNRNWDPYIPQTLQDAYDAGHRRLLMVTTSAYSCYSSCRQYREDIGMALTETGLDGRLEVDKIRQYFDHPGFVEPLVEGTAAGLADVRAQLTAAGTPDAPVHILFATHSIPTRDAEAAGRSEGEPREFEEGSAYVAQHLATGAAVISRVEAESGLTAPWSLVYQSRSGAPHVPWLEPDINDAIADLAGQGIRLAAQLPPALRPPRVVFTLAAAVAGVGPERSAKLCDPFFLMGQNGSQAKIDAAAGGRRAVLPQCIPGRRCEVAPGLRDLGVE